MYNKLTPKLTLNGFVVANNFQQELKTQIVPQYKPNKVNQLLKKFTIL